MGDKNNRRWTGGINMITRTSQKDRILVLMGGFSAEREVSIRSGKECSMALESLGYNVSTLDPGYDIINDLLEINPDIVFNCLHGSWGEDGHIQSILEYLKINYTHSGVIASAKAMNKIASKEIFSRHGIPIAKSFDLHDLDNLKVDFPIIIKPINGGSSIGVKVINNHSEALNYIKKNQIDLKNFFAEEFIEGTDFTCGVIGQKTTEIAEIKTNNIIFDYNAKYKSKLTKHCIPGNLKPNIYEKMKEYALRAHVSLNCKGVSRVDFRYSSKTSEEKLVCLEINTQPGMTRNSLLPDLASHSGIAFSELVEWIINDASLDR